MKTLFPSMTFMLFRNKYKQGESKSRQNSLSTTPRHIFSRWYKIFILFSIVICLALMTAIYIKVSLNSKHNAEHLGLVNEVRLLGLQIGKAVTSAADGDVAAFAELDRTQTEVDRIAAILEKGKFNTDMRGIPAEVKKGLASFRSAWQELAPRIEFILQRINAVTSLRVDVAQYNDVSAQRMEQARLLVDHLLRVNATASQLSLGIGQLVLIERISKNMHRTIQGGEDAVAAIDDLRQDAALLGHALKSLLEGDKNLDIQPVIDAETRHILREFAERAQVDATLVSNFLTNAIEVFQVQDTAKRVVNSSRHFVEEAERLQKTFEEVTERHATVLIYLGSLFGILALLGLVSLGVIMMSEINSREKEARLREELAKDSDRRNQNAILRLLDEIGDLANGDLTVKASVTEDFTGAIADAVNYAINELRSLVNGINTTTLRVARSARTTRATAVELLQASEEQSKEISRVTLGATEMAKLLQALSGRAKESSEVAHASVDIATKGSRAVQDTIVSMGSVREQIQETAKRIKRLGESSQEIGEIVGLIDDIADQTNILALNAAIQASMAGEAGRGFAVVADEVQRLAERSRHATKQIEGLAKAIQGDAKQAAVSMEKSTAGVVSGAQLAQGAGQALAAIEKVSSQLAGLIGDIERKASQQAKAAANIAGGMSIIQTITTKTSQGTQDTAKSIADLEEQADRLRTSVRGFKLPQEKGLKVDEGGTAPKYLFEEGRPIEPMALPAAIK
ncbi:MAG: methyl-accepting chemotaxis protein [Gammaproteobacteria bacterium]